MNPDYSSNPQGLFLQLNMCYEGVVGVIIFNRTAHTILLPQPVHGFSRRVLSQAARSPARG
jgi:hypothetical protein